jgi:hypothetical protein
MFRSLPQIASLIVLTLLVSAPVDAQAKRLSNAKVQRLEVLIKDAKLAKANDDLERVADLLSQAIAIKPDPALRWNLGRIYEGLCMFPDAGEQFDALASDTGIKNSIREEAELRARGLQRQRNAPSFRVRLKTDNVHLFIDGIKTTTEKDRIRFFSQKAAKHAVEMFVPGGWQTRIRVVSVDLKRCLTVDDELAALPPAMSRLRVRAPAKLATLEINGYRVRADIATLKEIEVLPGTYVVEARTETGELLGARTRIAAGAVATIVLRPSPVDEPEDTSWDNPPPEQEGVVVGQRLHRVKRAVSSQSNAQLWGWITLGTGIAIAGGGATLLAIAHKDMPSVDALEGMSQKAAYEKADSLDRRAAGGIAMISVGAAAVLAGLYVAFSDDENDRSVSKSTPDTGADVKVIPGLNGSVHMEVSF